MKLCGIGALVGLRATEIEMVGELVLSHVRWARFFDCPGNEIGVDAADLAAVRGITSEISKRMEGGGRRGEDEMCECCKSEGVEVNM